MTTALSAYTKATNRNTPQRSGLRAGARRRARALGVLSVGLGALVLLAPRTVAKVVGVPFNSRSRAVLLLIGLRELGSGAALLIRPASAAGAWSRLIGDAVDLGLIQRSLTSGTKGNTKRLIATASAVAGLAALDTMSAARLSRGPLQKLAAPIHVVKTITIRRSPMEVYAFWRDLANLPRFMQHLLSVAVNNGTSTWRAKAPAGMTVQWEATIILDKPGESLAWKSSEGADIPNSGVVRFLEAPGSRGTQVVVELKYEAPGGALGSAFAKLFGEEPAQQIAGDLRRLKQVLELGEVMHSDASIHKGMHAARPASSSEPKENLKTTGSMHTPPRTPA